MTNRKDNDPGRKALWISLFVAIGLLLCSMEMEWSAPVPQVLVGLIIALAVSFAGTGKTRRSRVMAVCLSGHETEFVNDSLISSLSPELAEGCAKDLSDCEERVGAKCPICDLSRRAVRVYKGDTLIKEMSVWDFVEEARARKENDANDRP